MKKVAAAFSGHSVVGGMRREELRYWKVVLQIYPYGGEKRKKEAAIRYSLLWTTNTFSTGQVLVYTENM